MSDQTIDQLHASLKHLNTPHPRLREGGEAGEESLLAPAYLLYLPLKCLKEGLYALNH